MEFSANTGPITKLRFVLTANATTSGLAGLTALVAGERVDDWLDTEHSGWVRIIGTGLVAFALAVIALSHSDEQNLRRWVPAVSMADGGWVAASVATIIAGWYSSSGAAIIGIIAAIVGTFAITQMRLVGRIQRRGASALSPPLVPRTVTIRGGTVRRDDRDQA